MHDTTLILAVLALVLFGVAAVIFAMEKAVPFALQAAGLAVLTWALLLK